MIETQPKTGTQRLADTLKRCGVASSVHDAHRMAGEIEETEKKVQTHFDIKKEEIKEEMIKRVHGGRKEGEDEDNMKDYRQDNFNGMVERAKKPEPVTIRTDFETPRESEDSDDGEEEGDSDPKGEEEKAEEKEADILQSDMPLKDVLSAQTAPQGDYISKYMDTGDSAEEKEEEHKEEMPMKQQAPPQQEMEKPQVEPQQEITEAAPAEEKEEPQVMEQPAPVEEKKEDNAIKVDINDYFNFANKDMKPSEKMAQSNPQQEKPQEQPKQEEKPAAQPHPKTGKNQEIDINDYFNFAKRGLL